MWTQRKQLENFAGGFVDSSSTTQWFKLVIRSFVKEWKKPQMLGIVIRSCQRVKDTTNARNGSRWKNCRNDCPVHWSRVITAWLTWDKTVLVVVLWGLRTPTSAGVVGRLIIHFQERKKITSKCEAVYNCPADVQKCISFPVTQNAHLHEEK